MDCKNYQDQILSDYIDNELNAKDREALERHVTGCGACRELVESARLVSRDLKKEEMLKPPGFVWDGIRSVLREPVKRLVIPYWARGLAVAGIIACILAVNLHREGHKEQDLIVSAFLEDQMNFMAELSSDIVSEDNQNWF